MRRIFQIAALSLAAAPPAGAQSALAPDPSGALAVEYVTVQARSLTMTLRLTGTIEARDSIDLSFPRGGRISEITVEAGNRVAAGQALARTDGVQQQQALAQAEAAVAAAQAAEHQARQAADRAEEMLRRGVGTRAARDSARQALSAAQGQLESARTTAEQARRAADDTVLKAPQDAVVTARMAEPGQVVGPAQRILSLAAQTGLEAVFPVPDAPQLDQALGAPVDLRPIDHPERELTGKVSEIAPLVDAATGSVTVRTSIDGPLDPVLLGAAVVGRIRLPAGAGIELPWTALTVTGGRPAVWKIGADDTVSIVPIEIDRYDTGALVVKSGLEPGDTVVGEGSQLMYPGRLVTRGKLRS